MRTPGKEGDDMGEQALELGAHTLPYRAYPLARALEGIARAGFRYTGIWNDHAGAALVPPDAGPPAMRAVRRQVEAAGLKPQMAFRFPAATNEPAAVLRRTIEVAAEIGIPFVLSSGPSPYVKAFDVRKRDMLFHREAEAYFAALRQAAPLAERLGVTIVIKPHMGVTGTGQDLADIVELVDHPHVRVCYDAGNVAYYEGLQPEEDVLACARDVAAVCVKDHRGPRFHPDFPIPGQGDVDHAQVFRALVEEGFSGPCLVERVDGQQRATDMPAETIDAALAQARRYLAAAAERAQAGAVASVVREVQA
jgi:sugar phosphate isomerase/epimerase